MKSLITVVLVVLLTAATARAQISSAPSLQAGEAGVLITWKPNQPGSTAISLTGLTVAMTYGFAGGALRQVSCSVANDGLSASYIETAADFPLPGTESVQFIATGMGGAIVRKSPVKTITILSNIPGVLPTPGP